MDGHDQNSGRSRICQTGGGGGWWSPTTKDEALFTPNFFLKNRSVIV